MSYQPSEAIKDAAKHGELVVFVGAGASMLCGSPSWIGFAAELVKTLEINKRLTFLQGEQLRAISDPRRTASIALGLAKNANVMVDFDRILHPQEPREEGKTLYRLLASLRPVFVTTNYDKYLDFVESTDLVTPTAGTEQTPTSPAKERAVYYRKEQLSPSLLAERGSVIHLHGSYRDPDSMVVSLRDYINHYADSRVKSFLREMFRSYTVLFLGYGLAELELLEYIVKLDDAHIRAGTPRHFLLLPYRSSEAVQTEFLERYFLEQCSIQVSKYCIDTVGFGELIQVLKEWQPQIDVRDANLLDLQHRLDRFIADGHDTLQRQAAIRLLSRKPELVPYFMNSVLDPVWFPDLDAMGYFNPQHNPTVMVVEKDSQTLYQAPNWPSLRVLEHTAVTADEKIGRRIVDIIRHITHDATQRGVDNWRTWWSLAVILSSLQPSYIELGDLQLIRTWLASKFDVSMAAGELGDKLLPKLLQTTSSTDAEKALLLVDILTNLKSAQRDV